MKRILITGALGQIGSELTVALKERYGEDKVIVSDRKKVFQQKNKNFIPFEIIEVTDINRIKEVVKKYNIGTIYHLAAILSATGEKNPELAWSVNVNGTYNVLEIAKEFKCSVFFPSSIAVFGPNTPKDNTPQDTIQRPNAIYGITKVTGELLCDYYYTRFGVNTRGLRYPGLISYKTMPGGGTTDYAVEIFYEAIKHKKYICYLRKDTMLDMMYMSDAIKATINLMEVDGSKLKHRNAFNITAMHFTPQELADEIKKYIPDFKIEYNIDPVKQSMADSWPNSLDDSAARQEWGWEPEYTLQEMTKDMIEKISIKLKRG